MKMLGYTTTQYRTIEIVASNNQTVRVNISEDVNKKNVLGKLLIKLKNTVEKLSFSWPVEKSKPLLTDALSHTSQLQKHIVKLRFATSSGTNLYDKEAFYRQSPEGRPLDMPQLISVHMDKCIRTMGHDELIKALALKDRVDEVAPRLKTRQSWQHLDLMGCKEELTNREALISEKTDMGTFSINSVSGSDISDSDTLPVMADERNIETDTLSIDSGRGSGISDSDTLSVRSDDGDDISKKSVASRYEKDDSDLAHYGRSKRDDGRKTAFDAVSYLTTSLTNKSDKTTLTTQDIDYINVLIKENKLTFYDVKSRAVTHGDLKIIRELALNKPEEDFYENIENDLNSLSQLLATPSDTEKKIDTALDEHAVLMKEMKEMDAMSDEENDAMNNMEWDDEFGNNR